MLVESILKKLNIEYERILPFQKGYRNRSYPIVIRNQKSEVRNLIIYKNEADILNKIKNADLVSNYLFKKGLPTRKSLSPIIKIKLKNSTRYARLYNYLDGETILWESYTKNHIKMLGKAMAILHEKTKSQKLKTKNLPLVTEILNSQILEMKEYFSKPGVRNAMKRKLNLELNSEIFKQFSDLIFQLSKLPHSILHMDLVRSNILFSETKNVETLLAADIEIQEKFVGLRTDNRLLISGILDFEKVALGPEIVDIARTLAFLIIDCKHKDEKKVRKYFLRSGYLKYGGGKFQKLEYLEQLLTFFCYYDLYKFLVHNPYETLQENDHYKRTFHFLFAAK